MSAEEAPHRAEGSYIAQAGVGATAIVANTLVVELDPQLSASLRRELEERLGAITADGNQIVTLTADGAISGSGSDGSRSPSPELKRLLSAFALQRLPKPYQLPKMLPTFTGRLEVSRRLRTDLAQIRRTNQLICVSGMGGVGKSAFATNFAHRNKREFPDGILWADLRMQNTAAILDGIALAYGTLLNDIRDRYSKAEAVRSILADKRALLVLDNAEHSNELDLLIPSGRKCVTLVTTRHTYTHALRGSYRVDLALFSEAECLEHIQAVMGSRFVEGDVEAAKSLSKVCGYLPLAVDIAATLADRTRIGLSSLTELLSHEAQSVNVLRDRERSLEACFELSAASLPKDQLRLFLASSIFQSGSFQAHALAHMTSTDIAATRILLGDLVAASLLGMTEAADYYMHPLIREFASVRLTADAADEAGDFRSRLARYYLSVLRHETSGEDPGITDYGLLRLELDNVIGAYNWAVTNAPDSDRNEFCSGLAGFLFRHGYWAECKRVLEDGANAAQHAMDDAFYYSARLRQAELASEMGAYSEANEYLLECLSFYARPGSDQRLLARSIRELGELRRAQRKYQEARRLHARCLKLRRQERDIPGVAQSLHDLGVVDRILGNYDSSETLLHESLALSEASGDVDQQAYTLLELGMLARRLGSLASAEQLLGNAQLKFAALGDKRGAAYSSRELGEVCIGEHRYDEAARFHGQSLEMRLELGDRRGEALARHRLGYAQQCLGRLVEARASYDASMNVARAIGDQLAIGLNEVRIGELLAEVDSGAAKEYWRSGLAALDAIGVDAPEREVARWHLQQPD